MYSFDSKVRYSEADYQGNLTTTSIIDYFQDCSNFQSEKLGVGLSYLMEHHVAWVLVSWQIEVERYPKCGEPITVGTWPYDFKGFYGYRNFLMTDEAGRHLAYANSMWVLIDTVTGHPARILPELSKAYRTEPPLDMGGCPRKMKLPEGMESREPFSVQKFHLDTNRHVNNGKYILMAQEYLPFDFAVGRVRVEYKKSAVYGDMIYPSVAILENQVVAALCDEENHPYAVIELEKMHD